RRRRGMSPGLIVGLSVGGAVLIAAAIAMAVILVSGKRSRHADDTAGGVGLPVAPPALRRPDGGRQTEQGDVRDAAVVDEAWARLQGRWDNSGPQGSLFRIDFNPDYTWIETGTGLDGRVSQFKRPTRLVRDETHFGLALMTIPPGSWRY